MMNTYCSQLGIAGDTIRQVHAARPREHKYVSYAQSVAYEMGNVIRYTYHRQSAPYNCRQASAIASRAIRIFGSEDA